ncbi:carboxymuconolactone decarboxylase family protein [Streptomyces sp. YIM 98790]|uniref:carboxymuconolactone decarboxylase family protein n=1 Tax=Streptomyces sp. YIM 98790 TaxID=2689077 RepID=UPI00140C4473|nr:carboxymuconolactone decarboxylase family protein [Streptomyces sp. YIM 98790]
MARISLTPRRTPLLRLAEWYSRRRYGKVMQPGLVYAHNPRVLRDYFAFERRVARWRGLDPALKHLAVMAASARIGCAWCMDFGYWEADRLGLPLEKVGKVPAWREHQEAFTRLERLVLAYAEAMTDTPPSVTDDAVRELVAELGEPAFVELTAMVALENLRSRVNSAAGLTSQGFSDSCAIPPRAAADTRETA